MTPVLRVETTAFGVKCGVTSITYDTPPPPLLVVTCSYEGYVIYLAERSTTNKFSKL